MPTLPVPVFAALVLAFLFLRLWADRGRLTPPALLLALCALQTLIIALAQHYAVPGMRLIQPVTAMTIPPMAWLALLTTSMRRLRPIDLLHALPPLATAVAMAVAPALIDLALPAAFTAYGAAIIRHALKGADAQPQARLADGDLPARLWLLIGAALVASALSDLLIAALQAMGHGGWRPWIITVFSVGNLLLIGAASLSAPLQTEAPPEPAAPAPPPDAELWERLQRYMAEHEPHLDPGLTLARLARKLGAPAKALSTTINRATGQNVSRFVNEARIRAAQAALLRGESVTEAMLSAGFNTKSNFNREFLRVAGDSPSGWLAAQNADPGQPLTRLETDL